jgi:hypothetical protein
LSFATGNGDEYETFLFEFRSFLREYKDCLELNRETTFDLIASHGRIEEMLYFAELIGIFFPALSRESISSSVWFISTRLFA